VLLERALRRDPCDETMACRWFDWLILMGDGSRAREVLTRWRKRRPNGAVWKYKALMLALSESQAWEPVLELARELAASAPPAQRPRLTFEYGRQLRRSGRFDASQAELERFLQELATAPLPEAERAELQAEGAHELTWLGHHARAEAMLTRLTEHPHAPRAREELLRLLAANQSYGVGDAQRYASLRNAIRNPRHHIELAPFQDRRTEPPPLRVLVLTHLHYPDLWPELRSALEHVRGSRADLAVSVHDDGAVIDAASLGGLFEQVTVRHVANRGFDIGGHWQLLDGIDLARYDLVMLLQGKKSGHTRIGGNWRRHLIASLVGTRERWIDNLHAFADDARLGAIGSALHQSSFHSWQHPQMRAVLQALQMPLQFDALKATHRFVSGSMLMIRAPLLARIHARTRNTIVFEDYEGMTLRRRMDDSAAHAIERALGMFVLWSGYRFLWRP
jgi:tetratricopeptide (TPR) repeat protein